MYKLSKANRKSILLLLTINFLTILTLSGFTGEVRAITDKPTPALKDVKIIDKNQIIDLKCENVDCVVTDNGDTINVTEFQAKVIERKRQEAIERKLEEEARERERQRKTIETSRNVDYSSIDVPTDLSVNNIINYWDSLSGTTEFSGSGQAFIDAAKSSGLDPVYILAHAGLESNWGKSAIARDKNNFFGIAAYDNSPYSSSYEMGNGTYDGIVSGATWIANNYYAAGQTNLYSMRYNDGNHEYCTSDTWMHDIVRIMQRSYEIIQ